MPYINHFRKTQLVQCGSFATLNDAVRMGFNKFNRFVPFIGVYNKFEKTPEQLRTEIRIAGLAGTEAIMICFYETFLNDPALAAVVARN